MANLAPDHIYCQASPGAEDDLLAPLKQDNTLHKAVRHILYLGANEGWHHAGSGSYFDGIPQTPRGIKDTSDFPRIVQELLRMRLDDTIIENVIGGNVSRVWAEVEEVAASKRDVSPREDHVSSFHRPEEAIV